MFALDLAILTCCEKKYIKSQIFAQRESDWHKKSVDLFVEKTVLQFNGSFFWGGEDASINITLFLKNL